MTSTRREDARVAAVRRRYRLGADQGLARAYLEVRRSCTPLAGIGTQARRARICQMSPNHGMWRLWHEVPGLWRYAGVFRGDGRAIEGAGRRLSGRVAVEAWL